MAPALRRPLQHRHVHAVEAVEAPLAGRLEAADRLDFVAEELHADRLQPVQREDVDNAAANRKFAGQLHRRRRMKAVPRQPAGQVLQRNPAPPRGASGSAAPTPPAREPAEAGPRRRRPPAAAARAIAASSTAAAGRRPPPPAIARSPESDSHAGNSSAWTRQEEPQVLDQAVHFFGPGTDDDQRSRGVGGQCGGGQRGTTTPRLRPKSPHDRPSNSRRPRRSPLAAPAGRPARTADPTRS